MLKTINSSRLLAPKVFRANNNKFVRSSSDRANETVLDLFKFKKSKNTISQIQMHIEAIGKYTFLTLSTKEFFNLLR